MTTFTDKIVSTSTGTAVTKTQLNGGTSYIVSNIAGALKEVFPVQAATGTLTAAETSMQKFSIESTSIGALMPKRWILPTINGGLGSAFSALTPITRGTKVNTALFYSNTPIDFYGQSYVANTAAFRVGATVAFTTDRPSDQECFYECVEDETSVGTAAATTPLNNITINGGTALKMIYAQQGTGVVTTAESYIGYLTVTSNDLTPIQRLAGYLQPKATGLGTAISLLDADSRYNDEDVQLRPTATLSATYTQDEAMTAAPYVAWGVGFLR